MDDSDFPQPAKGAWQWGIRRARRGDEYHLMGSHPESERYELYGRHKSYGQASDALRTSRAIFTPVRAGRRD